MGFSLDRRIVVLVAALLPVLLWLGNWQLERAREKSAIQSLFSLRQQQTPLDFNQLLGRTDLAFLPVRLNGRYDHQRVFLLDNKVYQGQVGYQVLVPFQLNTASSDGRKAWVLVNRGWIKAPPRRTELPRVAVAPGGEVSLVVEIYVPPGEGFHLSAPKENSAAATGWPKVIQAVNVQLMEEKLGQALYPYQFRLRNGEPGVLDIHWPPITTSPEKHYAYAIQWFAMAIALVLWAGFAAVSTRNPS